MKKSLLLLIAVVMAGTFLSCRDRGLDPETVLIGYVDAFAPDAAAKETLLVAMLETQLGDKTVALLEYQDETALLAAITAGTLHVAILSARGYAEFTTAAPGSFEAILSDVRPALVGQSLPIADQIVAMNVDHYRPVASATYDIGYFGLVIVGRTAFDASGTDRIATVADLAGHSVCTQSSTSAAGYVYPAALLDAAGLALVAHAAGPGEVEVVRAAGSGFPGAIQGVLDGACDAAFLYQDARSIVSVLELDPDVFAHTRVIAMTPKIHASLIGVDPDLNADLIAAIRAAFLAIAATGEGASALDLFDQAGYRPVTDVEYDGERRVYAFVKDHLS